MGKIHQAKAQVTHCTISESAPIERRSARSEDSDGRDHPRRVEHFYNRDHKPGTFQKPGMIRVALLFKLVNHNKLTMSGIPAMVC